jgi:cell division protein DivIC
MKPLNQFLRIARNKYFIAAAFFIVWMAFFDPRDWGVIRSRTQKLNELEKSEKHLTRQIEETQKELLSLQTSAATIEKYAREKYLMKRDHEEIFIIKKP